MIIPDSYDIAKLRAKTYKDERDIDRQILVKCLNLLSEETLNKLLKEDKLVKEWVKNNTDHFKTK